MRIGLLGAGRIGAHHAGVLASLPEVEGLLVADVAPERGETLAERVDGATAVGIDDVFASGAVDAVVIASSTDTHAEYLIRCAEAGLPAFCEKPIALDLESTRRAVAAVRDAGIVVQMGFQRRYDPAMSRIKDDLASGRLGRPYLVRSQTHDPAPPPLEYIPVSGGIFRDCMIHDIDAVRFVVDRPVATVFATGAVLGFPEIGELGDVDSATAVLTFDDGTLAQLSALRHDPVGYDVRLEVFASGGAVAAGWSPRSPIVSTEPGVDPPADPITSFWDRFADAYRLEMEAFVRVLRGEEAPRSTPADAYEDLRVAAACDRSLAEGRVIAMEEIE